MTLTKIMPIDSTRTLHHSHNEKGTKADGARQARDCDLTLTHTYHMSSNSSLTQDPSALPPSVVERDDIFGLTSDDFFMSQALRQALKAYNNEEVPVGAVIVYRGSIIARAHNQVEMLKDATAHAEILAITQAEQALGDWRLNECHLYVTKEPCPMCAGALVNARVQRVIFGCHDPRGGGAGGAMNILQMPTLNHRCEITSSIREEECGRLLKNFFSEKRPTHQRSKI